MIHLYMPEQTFVASQRVELNVWDRNKLTVGIVGYDGQGYDQNEVDLLLCQAFETIRKNHPTITQVTLIVLSGSQGIPAYTCSFAVHYYGWQTTAVISAMETPSDTMPIEHYLNIIGDVFDAFLEKTDVLLRVGQSQQAFDAVTYFRQCDGEVYEYDITLLPS